MTVKQHYNNHLGAIYSWMAGDFNEGVKNFEQFIIAANLTINTSKHAVDLGAGNGIQTVALAKLGYTVTAVDFCEELLHELAINTENYNVKPVNADILPYSENINNADLVVCWGDTLTHLNTINDVITLLYNCIKGLSQNGKLVLSFRDYTNAAIGHKLSIDVKKTDDIELRCELEYQQNKVKVTDIISKKGDTNREITHSSYYKLRLPPGYVADILKKAGLKVQQSMLDNKMLCIIAYK